MKVKTKVTVVSLLVVAAILVLIVSTLMTGSTGIILTISELLESPDEYAESYLQLEGNLIVSSVNYDINKTELYFEISDGDGILPVIYNDVTPDNFEDDVEVIVYGYFKEGSPFRAERLETRCPSKYEEEEQ